MKLRISVFSEIYVAVIPAWQLLLNAGLLYFFPSFDSYVANFTETTIALISLIGVEVGDIRLQYTANRTPFP